MRVIFFICENINIQTNTFTRFTLHFGYTVLIYFKKGNVFELLT